MGDDLQTFITILEARGIPYVKESVPPGIALLIDTPDDDDYTVIFFTNDGRLESFGVNV